MMLTETNKDTETRVVENDPEIKSPLPVSTRRRLLNPTVRFFGPNQAKVKKASQGGGEFSASGVIFNVSNKPANDSVTILTAVHNLLLWAGLDYPPNDWADVVKGFASAMTLYYGNKVEGKFVDSRFNKSLTGKLALNDSSVIEVPKVIG